MSSLPEAIEAWGADFVPLFEPSPETGFTNEPVEAAAIRVGARLCLSGQADALVTGPIHKARLAQQGFGFRGHTDFLGSLCGVEQPVMAFHGPRLNLVLVTTHVPLEDVAKTLTTDGIVRAASLGARALSGLKGSSRVRLGVCGLNPHAGEAGLLGWRDQSIIGPACRRLRDEGWEVRGPLGTETVFHEAMQGRIDLVVAMYHDQGLGPLKVVEFGRSVNWTLGLPMVRTSVDHGTADDLVGTGRADPGSMVAAMTLARRIVASRSGVARPSGE
jgi:4-hydroxythreonine-4-phosphate dehydrogenase